MASPTYKKKGASRVCGSKRAIGLHGHITQSHSVARKKMHTTNGPIVFSPSDPPQAVLLRNLYQFHLSVAPAMQHERVSSDGAKDEQVAIAKFCLFHCFLNGQRSDCNGFAIFEDMWFHDSRLGRK